MEEKNGRTRCGAGRGRGVFALRCPAWRGVRMNACTRDNNNNNNGDTNNKQQTTTKNNNNKQTTGTPSTQLWGARSRGAWRP